MENSSSSPAGALAVRAELRGRKARRLGSVPIGDRCAVLRLGSDSLWAVVEGRRGAGVALRLAWAPGPALEFVSSTEREIVLRSSLGLYRVSLATPNDDATLRVTTRLIPEDDVRVPWWPRDLYPLGEHHDPRAARGRVLAAQRGLNTALLYGRLEEPGEGTFFYLQDLTLLNDYFETVGVRLDGVVGGIWPELGYAAPPATESPLAAGREIVLSDAFLRLDPEPADDRRAQARVFLAHLAAIYPHLPKPEPQFRDWPAQAAATVRDLAESPLVTVEDGGYRYVRGYVDGGRPDSMAHLAVLGMVDEYTDWSGGDRELRDRLRAGIYRFFDPEVGLFRSYLATLPPPDGGGQVDSWYLYHPLRGLAKLAKTGDEGCLDLFLASIDHARRAARHFDYRWPIKFDAESFEITKPQSGPNGLGQTDVGGLYATVCLDAYEITGDAGYLDEARNAIRATADLGFDIAYQTNLTSWGAAACVRLWKEDGDPFFRDQAHSFLASFFHNCAIWEPSIGKVRAIDTFLGVTCLHDGPYMAAFECYESFCALSETLVRADAEGDLSPGATLLVAEFVRYALHRAWWFYPAHLPETALAHHPKEGKIVRALALPLEDIYADGAPAGQVGQEVYGAGAALAYATRGFHPLGDGRLLFCEAPVRVAHRSEKEATFVVCGPADHDYAVRILPPKRATVTVDGRKSDPEAFSAAGGATIHVRNASSAAHPEKAGSRRA